LTPRFLRIAPLFAEDATGVGRRRKREGVVETLRPSTIPQRSTKRCDASAIMKRKFLECASEATERADYLLR
jgi:hypothetical protein